jgi:hypothetical protein
MDRAEFNSCVSSGLAGKQFGKDERKLEFCILAKMCSGKTKSREEAKAICSQPKPEKPAKEGKKRGKKAECPEFDPTSLIPKCEAKLNGLVKSGELPQGFDVPGVCYLILG